MIWQLYYLRECCVIHNCHRLRTSSTAHALAQKGDRMSFEKALDE
jgi:hypothetical protein